VAKWSSKEDAVVARIDFPPGAWGGETVFAPRTNPTSEDDGYLINILRKSGDPAVSELLIWDAKTMDKEPVARVTMPNGPAGYGFHGAFLSKKQLDAATTQA